MYTTIVRGGEFSNCIFRHAKHNLTDKDFFPVYGDRYNIFSTKEEADEFASKKQHAWVSKLFIYKNSDIEIGGKVKPGAKRITTGWLVSMVSLRRVK